MKKVIALIWVAFTVLLFASCDRNDEVSQEDYDKQTSSERISSERTTSETSEDNSVSVYENTQNPELLDALDWKTQAEFFFSSDGVNCQITAYKAAMAWLRADKEELSRYLTDPEYDVGIIEGRGDLSGDIEYMVFKFPDPAYTEIKDGVYPASYQLARKGMDSAFYIDMELIKTDEGWKVISFVVQG